MTPAELKAAVQELGMPAFTAKQIAQWLYEKHVSEIDEMTNLSKQNRERLSEHFEVGAMAPLQCQRSKDGTVKYLFPVLTTHHSPLATKFVETVYIPDGERATLCVSCQAEGKLTAATVVDHIIPHRGDMKLFWDESNWQPLCKEHHDQKTGRGL